jgi:hypothetical protein
MRCYLYKVLPPGEAFALSQRFEPHYTLRKGSWLNMAEIEFAALSKRCFDRRLPAFETLRQEVLAWADKHNLITEPCTGLSHKTRPGTNCNDIIKT